jgi:hypothetical protein
MIESKTACALLVQLVERRSPKPDVGGSSPPGRAQEQNKTRNNYTAANMAVSANGFG